MRKRRAEKRPMVPDPKFGDPIVSKFINCIMLQGKKSIARSIVYDAFDIIEERAKQNPLEVFHKAMQNVAP
ncbi:MAG TPA: 30S ribosomal protein S7, partial [Candidatus Kapabacteria bacterium]|nr:30S ribosomal protein S7 [Candidatus Kapabacteria bacterium]